MVQDEVEEVGEAEEGGKESPGSASLLADAEKEALLHIDDSTLEEGEGEDDMERARWVWRHV